MTDLHAQAIAKATMNELYDIITVGMSEREIEEIACMLMQQKGADEWWYHGIGAIVLVGAHATLSQSGRALQGRATRHVAHTDIITIDLTPARAGQWGDYARTLFMEDGVIAPADAPQTPLFRHGVAACCHIHATLRAHATPDMTCAELYTLLNDEIMRIGYENLDFRGNVGHTITHHLADRAFIDHTNTATIRQLGTPFTVEPHIRLLGSTIGFKREDIYVFDEHDRLQCV